MPRTFVTTCRKYVDKFVQNPLFRRKPEFSKKAFRMKTGNTTKCSDRIFHRTPAQGLLQSEKLHVQYARKFEILSGTLPDD